MVVIFVGKRSADMLFGRALAWMGARNEESLRTPLLPVGAPPSPANRTTTVARGRSPEEIFFDPPKTRVQTQH